MSTPSTRYVRNTRTGVIYPFTPILGKHKHCETLSIDLCIEYERRSAESPESIKQMEQQLMDAAASGEPMAASDLAGALKATDAPVAKPVSVDGVVIPDDFDLDIDISTMNKPDLLAIAKRINLPVAASLKVADVRSELTRALDSARIAAAAGAPQGGTENADANGISDAAAAVGA